MVIDQSAQNEMPQAITDAVTRRDCGVCCVTGRADLPTTIIWAFPPSMAYMVCAVFPATPSANISRQSYQSRDIAKPGLHEEYRSLENAITLCNTLVEPYMENMFSIDIEVLLPSVICTDANLTGRCRTAGVLSPSWTSPSKSRAHPRSRPIFRANPRHPCSGVYILNGPLRLTSLGAMSATRNRTLIPKT